MLVFMGFINTTTAQIEKPVVWSYSAKKLDKENVTLFIRANLEKGWHIYSQKGKIGGPTPTKFLFTPSKDHLLLGVTQEPKPMTKFEKVYGFNVSFYENEVIFQQKIKLKTNQTTVRGKIEFMACNDFQCLPPDEIDFKILVK